MREKARHYEGALEVCQNELAREKRSKEQVIEGMTKQQRELIEDLENMREN